jgi:single-strand DNA-binding protein
MVVPYQRHHVVAFGRMAETCKEYLKKGRQVYVEGRLQTREFEVNSHGSKRQRTEIIANRVQFLGTPPAARADTIAVEEPPIPPTGDVPF